MNNDRFQAHWILGGLVLFGLGVLGGTRLPDAPPEDDGHDHGDGGAQKLNDRDFARLERLGVQVATVERSDFVATVPVQAVIESFPESHRVVYAPIGGRVIEVHTRSAERLDAGEPVVTLLRAPLPRPSLTITANVLTPAQESLHEAVKALRARALEVDIVSAEIDRVQKLQSEAPDGLPVVSPQRLVDLRYELARAETAMLGAREEAEKHGLGDEQIAAVIGGEHGPGFDGSTWRAALTRNGLWTGTADALYETLPREVQRAPWAIATIGELTASGLADDELVQWLAADAAAAEHFLDIGVLMQRGHTLADLQAMHDLGAFEPIVVVRAPAGGAETFDVDQLHVQPGAVVASGAPLADLDELARVRLAIQGVGAEVAMLSQAASAGSPLRATPLLIGTGPLVDRVTIELLRGGAGGGSTAYATLDNEALASTSAAGSGDGTPRYRTWALRPGMRYLVHVPSDQYKDVFVLPAEAVFREGGESAVLVRHDGSFDPHPIIVAYRDGDHVVVTPSPLIELVAGDVIVARGVLDVKQALNAGNEDAGAHHGHSH